MTPAPRRRLVQKLGFQIAFLLAAVLLPLTLVSMVNSATAVQEMRARSEAALTGETMLAAAKEIRLIQEARGSAAAIASLIVPMLPDPAACIAALRSFAKDHPNYSQVSFIPVSGQLRCSSTGKMLDVSDNPNFQNTVRAQRPGFSVSRFGPISGTSVLAVSHPVFDGIGQYLGYIGMSLPHSTLEVALVSNETTRPLELMTFDRDGELLAATGGLEKADLSLPRDRSLKALMSETPTAFSALSVGGENKIYSVVPVVPAELFALGIWPADPNIDLDLAPVPISILVPALIWVASLVVAVLSVEWLVNRPIRRLNTSINAFAKGDRNLRNTDVGGAPLEIREMAAAFELMTDAVMRDEAELEDTVHQKEVLLREVHHRVKNNLQMIASIMNMHGRKAQTLETQQVIKGLQGRVMSLATIHRELYQTTGLGDVHASELLDAIARQTVNVAARPDRRFDLQLELADIRVTPDQAVPLAMLAGEGLMNAMACAGVAGPQATALTLRLIRAAPDGAMVEITTLAEAEGSALSHETEESRGISGQLLTVFAMQLGGKLEQTNASGLYRLAVSFQLRPLAEGEDRHAVHAENPV